MKPGNVIKIINPKSTAMERAAAFADEGYRGINSRDGLLAALENAAYMLMFSEDMPRVDGKCPACREKAENTWSYCPHCGQRLKREVRNG